MATRVSVLEELARRIPPSRGGACVLVAIDGPDGSGKTTLADDLAPLVRALGRPVVRVSADDFHHVRQFRYRRGRDSPVGFWLDSYDYPRLIAEVLDPLSPSGNRRYRPVGHELSTDRVLDGPWCDAPPGAVVLVDGLFLHRDCLAGRWDFSLYLDVPAAVTAGRMAIRDGTHPDPDDPSMRRYVDAQRIYHAECDPRRRATVVLDNSDPDAPTIQAATGDAGSTRQDRDMTVDPVDLTLETYEATLPLYLAASAPPSGPLRDYLDQVARLVTGQRQVLELGSGPGTDADYLESAGLTVQRTDATEAFLDRLRSHGHDAQRLDLRDDDFGGPYDAVLADAVLLHVGRAQFVRTLATARRAVKPGGLLAITVKEGDGEAWSTAKLGRPRHFTYWREDRLRDAVASAGWEVLSIERTRGRTEPWLFVFATATTSATDTATTAAAITAAAETADSEERDTVDQRDAAR